MTIRNRLKIDKDIPKKKLSRHIWTNLGFLVGEMRALSGGKLIMLDMFVIFFLLTSVVHSYIYIVAPIWLLLTAWQIRLHIKNPYTVQYETVLFYGVFGLSGAVIHLILSHKLAYIYMGITSMVFYVLILAVYLFASWMIVQYQLKRFTQWERTGNTRQRSRLLVNSAGLLAGAPALGYSFAQATKESEKVMYVVLFLIMVFFSLLCFYFGAKFLFRYVFMKANPHLVKLQQPSKKDSKQGIITG